MPKWKMVLVCVALAGAVELVNLGCQSADHADTTALPAAATQPAPMHAAEIDARADAALRRMSDTLAKEKAFRVHSTATIEERLESGQIAQFSRDTVIQMGRPDRLWAEMKHGSDTRRIWHQGRDLTILDVPSNKYAVVQTPEKIGEMLDFLADEYGIIVPMDDLLYPAPYDVLTEHVESGVFVDQQEISGHTCDHLLFTQENVDWQIWIGTGTSAVPRRVVITYKGDSDHRQYEANLDDWQFGQALEATAFTPQLPPAAQRVELSELTPAE